MKIDGMEIQNEVLTRCTLRETECVIPDGVRVIGPGAFKGCVSLERVVLPDSVAEIGPEAFKGCRRLQTIRIPSGLARLGAYAFYRCHNLEEIFLPDGVTELGDCTFLYCDALKRAALPGVVRLGRQVFLNDLSLQTLTLSPALPLDQVRDVFTGCGNLSRFFFAGEPQSPCLLDSPMQALSARFPGPELVRVIAADVYRSMELQDGVMKQFRTNLPRADVPEGVSEIAKSCFFDKRGISSVRLPKSLRVIGSRAFANCINLEQLELGSLDLSIAPDAFQNCSALRRVVLPDGSVCVFQGLARPAPDVPPLVARIHEQLLRDFVLSGTTLLQYLGREVRPVVPDGVQVIGRRAFAENDAIDRVILPESVVEIQTEAFADCPALQAVPLPAGLERLGEGVFAGCRKLIRAVLPETLRVLPASAFRRCDTLREVVLHNAVSEIGPLAFDGCLSLRQIALPQGLKAIGDMAFYKCRALQRVALPESLTYLGTNAFAKSGLTAVTLPRSPETWGENCFAWCERLKTLVLGAGVRTLGPRLAYQCPRLERVDWPEALVQTGSAAFAGTPFLDRLTDGLTANGVLLDGRHYTGSVALPKNVIAIGGGAFAANTAVTELQLPERLRCIGPQAFLGCTGLREITLPAAVSRIEPETFAGCENLRVVHSVGRWEAIGDRAFLDCAALDTLPELAADVRFGGLALEGTAFLDRLRRENPLVVLGQTVVDGQRCTGPVTLPDGVRRVAGYAFRGNQALTAVRFPDSLDELGPGAFQWCSGLTALSCLVVDVPENAFGRCSGLRQVELPYTRFIGPRAFEGCGHLRQCAAPLAEHIGREAFQNCPELETFPAAGAEYLGERAFAYDLALRQVRLAAGAVLEAKVFEDCARLEELELDGTPVLTGDSFWGCTALRTVQVPGERWPLRGWEALFAPQIPQIVRQVHANALACFSFRFPDKTVAAYHGGSPIVHIPDGIRAIGPEVFRDRLMLEEIHVPDSVTAIGPRAFHGTPWLERRKIAEPLPVIHGILPEAAPCQGVVTLPARIQRVAGWAFTNQYELEGVRLENDRTFLEPFAFRNCIKLRSFTLADGRCFRLDRLEDRDASDLPPFVRRVFQDCMNCFRTNAEGVLIECTGNIPKLTLPLGITAIGDGVFAESNLLETIVLTPEVRAIGANAFTRCRWLELVSDGGQVERLGERAFFGCTSLRRAEFGPALREIGKRAFENCTALEEIALPEGVLYIPERAFFRCRSLRKVVLPASLYKVEREAFAGCAGLEQVVLPPGVRVEENAFTGCSALEARP